ncbi:hypothetical protein F5Y04DRAFT_280470 [Hypomontagnella monticulosa]|nr:hypothetical protein F5Y04DRAFT_280470 [Hypomontagnella monticulosa]
MESTSTPRISAALMDSYVGQNVIIVGKVLQLRGEVAFLEADGQVQANLNRDCHLMVGNGAQIIGKVNPDLSVKVLNAIDLGSNVGRVSLGWSAGSSQQQSTSQQSQPEPQFLTQSSSKNQKQSRTVAEIANNTASSPALTATTSSQSSRVITPPTHQLSQLSIQETSQSSQFPTQPSAFDSTQPTQPSQPLTEDTQYTEYTEYTQEATSSLRSQKTSYLSPKPSRYEREAHVLPPEKGSHHQHYHQSSDDDSIQDPVLSSSPIPEESSHHPPLSPAWSLPRPSPSPSLSPSPPPLPPRFRGRLFRTRSGNLVNAAEIRRRRELDRHADELLDVVLEDIQEPSHIVTFGMDEEGRWRIVRRDVPEVETYEDS